MPTESTPLVDGSYLDSEVDSNIAAHQYNTGNSGPSYLPSTTVGDASDGGLENDSTTTKELFRAVPSPTDF
jgi:hypothetical protein